MKPSKPFPNGMTYMWWNEQFCCRCNKYKLKDGMPLPDNCETENAMAISVIDETKWPSDKIISTAAHDWICLEFQSDDKHLMESYKTLFEEEKK
jgi:hypothetical protein